MRPLRAGPWSLTSLLMACSALMAVHAQEKGQQVGTDDALFPPELVEFLPSSSNPVFSGTGRDTWDQMIRERGFILFEDDRYHLWYTGYRSTGDTTRYLGYAVSADGIHWTPDKGNPLFVQSWVEDVFVVKRDGVYYMFAEGLHDIAHLLTSTDRRTWSEHGPLDVRRTDGRPIDPGPYGTPTVWIEGDIWYLFYERRDAGVWLATSQDRKVWVNVQDEPVIARGPTAYDREAVALNQVIKYRGRYYGYYHAAAERPWRNWTTNVAVSDDLIHWRKYAKNPIVAGNQSSGIVVHDGRQWRLYTMHPEVRLHWHQRPR